MSLTIIVISWLISDDHTTTGSIDSLKLSVSTTIFLLHQRINTRPKGRQAVPAWTILEVIFTKQ